MEISPDFREEDCNYTMNIRKHSELQARLQTLVSAFHATPPYERPGCPYHSKPKPTKSIEKLCDSLLHKSKESTPISTTDKFLNAKTKTILLLPHPRKTAKKLKFLK
ncbi:hypothetical protein NPIL_244291 [Nephila pilipes]|uniref:Uncharacterized protein n=1 Tax=Nephila pilipes TaxID=299642 RepID=A0A8X6N3I5_NEPPI|nr:hypothetical protein NPIL_244291 [Nephila pilipes]